MAELGLAIVGTIELCFRWGNKVIDLCNNYRHADEDIRSRTIRFEANWFRTQKQLDFLRQISGEMDEYHRHINHRTIEQLHIQLKFVWDKLNGVSELPEQDDGMFRHFRRKALRWKFVLIRESLDQAIEELDKWHATADPSWYLLLRISNNKIDQFLTIQVHNAAPVFPTAVKIREARNYNGDSGVFLPPKDLENMLTSDIPLCTAKLTQRRSSSRGVQNLILTTLECPTGANVDKVAREVRELARKLAVDDPKTFGLLCCKGVVRTNGVDGRPTTFTIVFRSPQNCANVSSLRSELLSKCNLITLGDKFAFARQLAKSISYIHTLGFVHKSVRPENILIFRESNGSTPPSAYLAGFDSFRKEDGRTYRKGIYEWEKNIYQHPSRQGLSPRDDYVIQHDIYSLRVCLLEIGLWDSFTIYDTSGKNPTPSSLLNPFAVDCQAGRVNVTESRDYLLRLCREQLPRHMGPKYGAVVETCLTCLDPDNVDFGDEQEFMDRDGILVGVRYIEKVLSRLNEISL